MELKNPVDPTLQIRNPKSSVLNPAICFPLLSKLKLATYPTYPAKTLHFTAVLKS